MALAGPVALGGRATCAAALLASAAAMGAPPQSGPALTACPHGATARYDSDIAAAVADVEPVWAVPDSLVKAVIQRESAFTPSAVSSAGAIGLMQVLPSNASRLGLQPEALWRPAENILAGTRLLAVLLKHYRGDVISALVAYNAGPRQRLAPVPDNGETRAYVRAVLHLWTAFQECGGLGFHSSAGRLGRRRHEFFRGLPDRAGVD